MDLFSKFTSNYAPQGGFLPTSNDPFSQFKAKDATINNGTPEFSGKPMKKVEPSLFTKIGATIATPFVNALTTQQPNGTRTVDKNSLLDVNGPVGMGEAIMNKGQEIGNQIANPTVMTTDDVLNRMKKIREAQPNITDEQMKRAFQYLKEHQNVQFSDNPLDKVPNIPRSIGGAIVKGTTGVLGGLMAGGGNVVQGAMGVNPEGQSISSGEANSQMIKGATEFGMSTLGGIMPGTTGAFNTGIGESVMKPIGQVSKDITNNALNYYTNLDPNSQEYKNYSEAGSQILPMAVTAGGGKILKSTSPYVEPIITKIGEKLPNIPNIPKAIGDTIGSTAEYGTSLATGLSKESQQIIKKSPELYKQARLGGITSEGELGNFAKATEARLTDLSELGKGYDSIRKGTTVANADEIGNIYLNRTKEIPTTQLTKADKIVLKDASDYMSQLKGNLTDGDILALRKQLDSISYDPNTGMKRKLSPQGARLVEGMRSDVDAIAKGRITGLKELDTKYAPEVRLLKEIKSNIYDSNGNIKNNALSTISNIVGKNKDLKLAKFEEIYPDLGKRLRALKAYEEVSGIASMKTGSIVRQLGGAAVGSSIAPGIGTIIGFIATNPHIVARILEAYGMATSKIKSILRKGSKINPQEITIVKEAIKKVPKSKVEDIITNIKFNPKTEEKVSKTLIKKPIVKKPIVKPKKLTK